MRPAEELLYDSEASFRLVDQAIQDLNAAGVEFDGDTLRRMHGHLKEVSAATEAAASDILDGLARAAALAERLDGAVELSDAERRLMVAMLRDELGNVESHLQFQDITGQRLRHIGHLLSDVPNCGDEASGPYDQAVADEIVAIRSARRTA